MAIGLWIGIGVVAILIIMAIVYYNRFVVVENRIDNALSQIDVQLKRRADLIPDLVKTVKGYAKHEKEAIKEVTDSREKMMNADDRQGKMEADNQLQSALKSIFAIAENYPDLKANENFKELQNELTSTEDKIAYSRQFYNDTVLNYNNMIEKFPATIFAGVYGKQERDYLEIEESAKKKPNVSF